MNEDMSLENVVKAALEADTAMGARRMQALMAAAGREARHRRVRRLFGRWGASALVAASLAAVFGVVTPYVGKEAPARPAGDLSEAIGLLCELDGVSAESVAAASPGEMLLAWQEAPCADLL